MTNATTRWSHLVRHGLIGSSLVAAAAGQARAERCDEEAARAIGFVIGMDISPRPRLIGGIEARACLDIRSEAILRIELGGGAPRMILGAGVRPYEEEFTDGEREPLGLEGGLVLDKQSRFGLHAAATYGAHAAYGAVQAYVSTSADAPTRISLLGGFSPWAWADEETAVPGRPLRCGRGYVRPGMAAPQRACASDEERAVRDHFSEAAQLELSSVWTFLRLANELAAIGAPASLVAAALDAADDEVRHAEMCGRAAGGISLAALPSSVARARFTTRSTNALAVLAAEAWHEGCLGETAASAEARYAANDADGVARDMLSTIAIDEARHAELSWSVLAWIGSVDPSVVAAATAFVATEMPRTTSHFDRALARHGVPSPAISAAARAHARRTAVARSRA